MIVIGAGAGGLVTSYIAAAVKAKVTLIALSINMNAVYVVWPFAPWVECTK